QAGRGERQGKGEGGTELGTWLPHRTSSGRIGLPALGPFHVESGRKRSARRRSQSPDNASPSGPRHSWSLSSWQAAGGQFTRVSCPRFTGKWGPFTRVTCPRKWPVPRGPSGV